MADENINTETLSIGDTGEISSGAETRIKTLSSKVETAAKERDEAKRLQGEAVVKTAEAQKERDFFSGFADVVASQPAAKEHKDEILQKFKNGYTVDDATIAVLTKAGKYQAPKGEVSNPAGGSAIVNPPNSGATKTVKEMTQAERREELIKLEQQGAISLT